MKKIVILILKIIIILAIVAWIFIVVNDYARAKKATKPIICLSEKTENTSDGEYYECLSLGYKYYELKKPNNTKDYGFASIFFKSPVREGKNAE